MEAAGTKLDQVHVLRQTFRPNEPFRAALSKLVMTGTTEPRPFCIYGSDERVIDMSDVGRGDFNVQLLEADKFMEKQRNVHLGIESDVKARLLRAHATGAVVLQLAMNPDNKSDYLHVREGLDVVRLGRRRQAIGFEAMQLYMNIPLNQLVPIATVKEGVDAIRDTLEDDATHRLYQVTPVPHLVGNIAQRPALPNRE
jgi:hypothetical protein